jgi:two-component system phosphate regulon sensor histidine kinase PhoR
VGRARKHPEQLAPRLANIVGAQVEILDPQGLSVGKAGPGAAEMLTVDAPAGDGYVVRLGLPIEEVRAPRAALRRQLLVAGALGLVGALALALALARDAARPLGAMSEYARRIAKGEYDTPPAQLGRAAPEEIGVLARSLAWLAGEVRARVADLEAERDRLSAILTGMVEGVLVVGADRRVLAANPSVAATLRAGDSPVGRSLEELALPEAVRALVLRALDAGEPSQAEVGHEGTALVVNVRPLPLPDGRGAVAVLHDVTRLRRLEGMRRDFVANVSHELRTPVTAIQGYSETLLGGGADPARARQFLEVIHRHGKRIGRLVEDLLRLSELEARPAEARVRERVALAASVAGALESVRRGVPGGEAASIELAVGPELVVLGDPDGLAQVIENLAGNAVRYGGARVKVSAERAGGRVIVRVADRGPGIAPEHLPRLFERFYRVDAHRSREAGGTGLGLAIVKHLVEVMDGRVWVESTPGQGTTFFVELPAAV